MFKRSQAFRKKNLVKESGEKDYDADIDNASLDEAQKIR